MKRHPTYHVVGTDHFPFPPEDFASFSFSTLAEAQQKVAELEKTPMTTARIQITHPEDDYPSTLAEFSEWCAIQSGCGEPDFHPAWAEWEAIRTGRKIVTPEEREAALLAAQKEGHNQFSIPAINPS